MADRIEREPGVARLGPRALVLRLLMLALLLAAVVWLLTALVPGAGTRLANADAGWLALGVALELIACGGYAALFHATFSYSPYPLPALRSTQIATGELGAFAVVPTGVGGPLLRWWTLRRLGMPLRDILVRSVSHGTVLQLPYVAAAALLGAGAAAGLGPGRAPAYLALAPLALVAATLGIAVAAVAIGRRRQARGRRLRLVAGRSSRLVLAALRIIPAGLREVPRRLRRPGALGGAGAYWIGDAAVLVVAFHAAGGSAPVGVVALAYMLGQLGNLLPLPGGIGGVEPLMLSVFSASGHGGAPAAAAIVLYRVVSLGAQGTLGALAAGTLVPALRR